MSRGGGGGGAVLEANGDVRGAVANKTTMTPAFESQPVSAQPTERRYVELDPAEFVDASKLHSSFQLTRETLGVAPDQPFRILTVTLLCEHPYPFRTKLSEVLDWVETPTGADGSAFRVHGDTVSALLVDIGACRVQTQVSDDSFVHALSVPFGGADALLWSCDEVRKRFEVHAATKEHVRARVSLVAELLVGMPDAIAVAALHRPRHTALVSRWPVSQGQLEVNVPIAGQRGLLRVLTAAVPWHLGPVRRVALVLDGRELVGLPGIVAALDVLTVKGHKTAYRPSYDAQLLYLPLSAFPTRAPDGSLVLTGELRLDAPAVRSGDLVLRITFTNQRPPPPPSSFVHVQACLLADP